MECVSNEETTITIVDTPVIVALLKHNFALIFNYYKMGGIQLDRDTTFGIQEFKWR